ncbi:hypothetical protein ACO0LV_10285 [Pseudactinotalea sp. Z1739]|uniref:MmyB family transcriptional regulator n=1 Tax=Pseudactinotalea sp. Z1739 TaxID=3413028 RepID=UPI003C7B371A
MSWHETILVPKLRSLYQTQCGSRFYFLDVAAASEFRDGRWEKSAHDAVAILQAETGRNPYDEALTGLVGELSTLSEDFRRMWASRDVRYHRTGTKVFHHPGVGRLELDYEALHLLADQGLQLSVYTAAPGSTSADALTLLASWVSTTRETGGLQATGHAEAGDHSPSNRDTTTSSDTTHRS